MLFLWTTTKLGKIWLDGDSFRQIVSKRLPEGYYCQDVSFVGEKDLLNIYIALPDVDSPEEKLELENKFKVLLSKSGIVSNINWIHTAPQDNPKSTPMWKLPLFWTAAAGIVTALLHLGLKGILWSLFASIIGYGVSWIFLTEDGQKQVSAMKEQFRR